MKISRLIKQQLLMPLFITSCLFAQIDMGSLLDKMIDRDLIATFPSPEYVSKQASSYDRNSTIPGGSGWFANADWSRFIRSEYNSGRKE